MSPDIYLLRAQIHARKETIIMSKYVEKVLADLIATNPNQPEFHQAATEILESLAPVFDKHPEYEIGRASCRERVSLCV